MTCNLVNNEAELRAAFDAVSNSQSGEEWAIFEYDANSNIVKLGSTGTGGLDQLLESFHSTRVQYGFATVAGNTPTGASNQSQRKVVLIHWQGAGVPAVRLATTASHVEEIRRFVRRVNLTIYARNDEDLDREALAKQFEKVQEIAPNALGKAKGQQQQQQNPTVATASVSTPFVPPTPVGAIYEKPTPQTDLDRDEREKFWTEMRDQEEARRREEADRKRQLQEQYAKEQKDLAAKLHKTHLDRLEMETQKLSQLGKSQSFDSSAIAGGKMGKLIAGRTQMFEQKVAELANSSAKPAKKPKNFKWQVNLLQPKSAGPPVNQVPEPPPKQFECVMKRKELPTVNQQPIPTATENGGGQQQQQQQMPETPEPTIAKIPVAPVPPVARQPAVQQQQQPILEEQIKKDVDPEQPLGGAESPPPNEPTANKGTKMEQQQPPASAALENGQKNMPTEKAPIIEEQPSAKAIIGSQPPQQPNTNGDAAATRAKALWDYQAEDATELTFNPDDIISDIQMVHDGWWYGRAPNGSMGLFPSNYVQLLM